MFTFTDGSFSGRGLFSQVKLPLRLPTGRLRFFIARSGIEILLTCSSCCLTTAWSLSVSSRLECWMTPPFADFTIPRIQFHNLKIGDIGCFVLSGPTSCFSWLHRNPALLGGRRCHIRSLQWGKTMWNDRFLILDCDRLPTMLFLRDILLDTGCLACFQPDPVGCIEIQHFQVVAGVTFGRYNGENQCKMIELFRLWMASSHTVFEGHFVGYRGCLDCFRPYPVGSIEIQHFQVAAGVTRGRRCHTRSLQWGKSTF